LAEDDFPAEGQFPGWKKKYARPVHTTRHLCSPLFSEAEPNTFFFIIILLVVIVGIVVIVALVVDISSYGFHSDDGNIYVQNGKGTKYSTPYAVRHLQPSVHLGALPLQTLTFLFLRFVGGQAGDVIGCYVSTRSALSFTRNGAELGSTPLPVGNYYPTSTSARPTVYFKYKDQDKYRMEGCWW
jgi:hypothetical protein